MRNSLNKDLLYNDRAREYEISNNLLAKRSLLRSQDNAMVSLVNKESVGRFKITTKRKTNTSLAKTTKLYMPSTIKPLVFELPKKNNEEHYLSPYTELSNPFYKKTPSNAYKSNLIQEALDLNIQNNSSPLRISTLFFRNQRQIKIVSISEHPSSIAVPDKPNESLCPIIITKAKILPMKRATKQQAKFRIQNKTLIKKCFFKD